MVYHAERQSARSSILARWEGGNSDTTLGTQALGEGICPSTINMIGKTEYYLFIHVAKSSALQ